ncbi:MFS transporter [Tersicoccus sp. Bi-70]|uniref:MFS transporter n=1 Tax=Tersicoccus sp. Bi-70 TaxID=1897634 RepID=UPI00350F0EE2
MPRLPGHRRRRPDVAAARDHGRHPGPARTCPYQGFFLAIFGVSAVLGPLIGGLFAGADQVLWIAGWRWVFLVNVPIGVVALLMVIAFLHLPRLGEHRTPRIDWWGATAVIVTLVPLLLVAEQGREWGWVSPGAITCYVLGGVGLVTFLLVERVMGDDAIIPLKLFGSRAFSMATVLGFLVGFAMFGAMLTLPLYLQIVIGLTPTESGFATLPMVLGLMIAAAGSGQIISHTGRYGIFPVTGTAVTAIGYLVLVFLSLDSPLWYVMIGMFLIGLGLGQLMQTLTLATQSAVAPRDMGVATSSSTFFRQIGGTMGTAVLLSVLFAVIPANIAHAMGDRGDLASSLDAALTPSVASAPANAGVMRTIWNPIVGPLKENVQTGLDQGAQRAKQAADAAVTQRVTAGVQQQVAAGRIPASAASGAIAQQVAAARPAAQAQALEAAARQAQATVTDGRLVVNWADAGQRRHWVDQLAPTVADRAANATGGSGGGNGITSDTSFLNGADARLTRTFMTGFIDSAVTIYRVGLGVILLAFVLSWFFRVPPLRQTSALQEAADQQRAADEGAAGTAVTAPVPQPDATGTRT